MAQSKDSFSAVSSIIGEGCEFRGEFVIKGMLRVDGYFKGLIDTDGLVLVGKNGLVETDIRALEVVVGGEVQGNIFAGRKVVLRSTARVKGDIVSPSIEVEDGVVFEGRCLINKTS